MVAAWEREEEEEEKDVDYESQDGEDETNSGCSDDEKSNDDIGGDDNVDSGSDTPSMNREYTKFCANVKKWEEWNKNWPTEPHMPDTFVPYRTEEEPENLEHIAGPGCVHEGGYHGHAISLEEMRGCTTHQCLVWKGDGWLTDSEDEKTEIEPRSNYYVTGTGDYLPAYDFDPAVGRGVHDTHCDIHLRDVCYKARSFMKSLRRLC